MSLELRCTNLEKILVTVNPATLDGSSAVLDGDVSVDVTGGDATVEMVDGKSFFLVSGDELGQSSFLVTGDADIGEGVEELADTIILNVEGAKAVSLGLVASEPVLK